jgi:hypothetical protein
MRIEKGLANRHYSVVGPVIMNGHEGVKEKWNSRLSYMFCEANLRKYYSIMELHFKKALFISCRFMHFGAINSKRRGLIM